MRAALLSAGALVVATTASAQPGFDRELYARLLERHTVEVPRTAGVVVDYRALGRSAQWRRLVAGLAAVDPSRLRTREERLAFWIDLYNLLAIDLVVRHYPVASIRDIGNLLRSVWRREAGRVGGRPVTLHEVEHEILRPLGEPRIHAAIVCASTSCPSLRREPYTPARLDTQLDDSLRRFLADPDKGARYEPATHTLWLSRIFDWFEEDFEPAGGVLAFVEPHLDAGTRRALAGRGRPPRVRHLEYDWARNDLAAGD